MSQASNLLLIILPAIVPALIGCRTAPQRHEIPATAARQAVAPTSPQCHSAEPNVGSFVQQASLVQPIEGKLSSSPEPLDEGEVLTLAQAIRLAFEANPDLVSASEQIVAADAALALARAEFYPRLGVSEQYGVSNNPVTAFMFQLNQAQLDPMQDFNNPRTTDDFHTQLRLQQSVYGGERRWHAMHGAEARVGAATMNLASLQNQLVFRIAEAYYRLLQARNLVAVRREAVTQVEQHLEIVRARFRNETAVKSDVLTVEVRMAEERESLISASNQVELAWAVLENVIGASVEYRELPEVIPVPPWNEHIRDVEAAVAAAVSERAEIVSLASQRQAATEDVLVAQAGKRLNVEAVADYDVFTGDFRRANDSFFAGVIVQLNLYDGGRTRMNVARACAKLREIQARERRLLLDVELDVRRAYVQLQDAKQRLEVTQQAIGQAGESVREIEVRYRGQAATITQLVDAQVALSSARVRRTNAQADLEIARASLERSVGRLTEIVQP
jgi:outer membrane protein TolC